MQVVGFQGLESEVLGLVVRIQMSQVERRGGTRLSHHSVHEKLSLHSVHEKRTPSAVMRCPVFIGRWILGYLEKGI